MIEKTTDKIETIKAGTPRGSDRSPSTNERKLTKPFFHGDVHWYPNCSSPNHAVMSVGNMCRVWAEKNRKEHFL